MNRIIQTFVSLLLIGFGLTFFTVFVIEAHIYNIHNNHLTGVWLAGAFLIFFGMIVLTRNFKETK